MISARYRDLAEEAFAANVKILENKLAILTWGNASSADPALGAFAIKPSGVPYESLSADAMVIVDFDGRVIEGDFKPSSDTKTHAVLFRNWPAVRGIVHTHSTCAVSWAQACSPIPVFGTTHADHHAGEIPCTEYLSEAAVRGDYETETGNLIVETIRRRALDPAELEMILVAGHGPFTWGASAEAAVHNAIVLEEICRMALGTLQIRPGQAPLPDYLVRKHWTRKHGADAYYGQNS